MFSETAAGENDGFAALVRRVRAARGLTQEALAREMGVSFATINGWENGRHRPIAALARLLESMEDVAAGPSGTTNVAPEHREERGVRDLLAASGWPPDGREARDFYNQPREFPGEVSRWRARMVELVRGEPKQFPGAAVALRTVAGTRGRPARAGGNRDTDVLRGLVDEGISYLREVARILALLHGTPDLGNKHDPVDELVYIILSRKTREDAYQRTYESLKARFPTWDAALVVRPQVVEKLVSSGGLGAKKTASVLGALRMIKARFGSCTLEPARGWPDEELEEFLCSLPEIHRKSAYCVMMYAFGRSVFPVDTHVGRVLSRLGPYRELGLSLGSLDHKQLQGILADLVPPNLRHSLHVNLVVHGREVCRSQKPLCGECELRNFCTTFRAQESSRIQSLERPRIADLFTGAGGLSEGFERAGFAVAAALDLDAAALRTYWLNHPAVKDERVLHRDVRDLQAGELRRLVGRKGVEVLIGAPPCQGFSHVGHRSKTSLTGYDVIDDERNFLYRHMILAAKELRPRLFLMENVLGMKSARKGDSSFVDAAAAALEKEGYRTAVWRLNAAAFGVPQDRLRMFLVAARNAPLPRRPPEPYQDSFARDAGPGALPPVTLEDSIFDLPAVAANELTVISLWPRRLPQGPRHRRYLSKFGLLSPSRLLFNHTVRYHNDRDLELYALLKPGEDSIHALERHGRGDLMRYRSDVFDDKYARLRGDRPCKTIVAHLAKDGNGYIHPSQVRSISFREAARVQSFRDDYVFCGSASDQWVQLGNAVPPVMAEAIARSFIAALGEKNG